MKKPVRIVITGAESTGKTTLARALATHYNALWIPEFARGFIEHLNRKYTYNDVEHIARYQIQSMERIPENEPLVFIDTWLIITKIWFEVVFGNYPLWLDEAIRKYPIDLFLLCDIDLPWIADPVRENGGEKRIRLHNTYQEELISYGFRYERISGMDTGRFQNALSRVEEFLKTM
ncbi:MAG TPA: ATP-binding protein [Prolixibacteraceae bacterium]|nr:ATP-binding protein [Prolixibacteraceae bacterium]